MDEITPLVTGVKYYSIYILLTERNYAVSYWLTVYIYIYYRLEEITPLVIGVKSYRMFITPLYIFLFITLVFP